LVFFSYFYLITDLAPFFSHVHVPSARSGDILSVAGRRARAPLSTLKLAVSAHRRSILTTWQTD
jgi:hypothetical protein